MIKTVSAYEARTNLGELLNLVYYNDVEVLIERMGKPVARIVKLENRLSTSSKKNLMRFAGIWNDKNGKIIEKNIRKFRKNFSLISS